MKNSNSFSLILVITIATLTFSCGPVIVSSRPEMPPPSWFYPNRVVTLRYIYFPNQTLYYDLSLRTYIYLDNGVWRRSPIKPSVYNGINLRRENRVRIENYYGDDIKDYHPRNPAVRSNKNTPRSSRRY